MDRDLTDEKTALRRRFRELRDSLGVAAREEIDRHITANLLEAPPFAQAEVVLTYLSFGAEVDTRGAIRAAWGAGKTVAIPRCIPGSNRMSWHVIEDLDGLIISSFGIEEPPERPETRIDPARIGADRRAVALVPALSFDSRGYRLGYGGGYYDVFLSEFDGASIGLCRSCQLSEHPLPNEPHDVPVASVVTELHARFEP